MPIVSGRIQVMHTKPCSCVDPRRNGATGNRALPDAELDKFVDTMAGRIVRFDKQSIADIKRLVDAASLPPNEAIAAEWDGLIGSVKRPAAQARIKQLVAWIAEERRRGETPGSRYRHLG
ncbi:hypothetical protein [Pseudomonas sp. Sample_16]|uniref:hypothetical protein n=1 Tax=Pseudomonas sp. Sample_16 TaxID=2448263 RepID=UPI001F4FDD0C|nr:hypothetical protein [Pseudomonas sp. Sample_16]